MKYPDIDERYKERVVYVKKGAGAYFVLVCGGFWLEEDGLFCVSDGSSRDEEDEQDDGGKGKSSEMNVAQAG